MSDIHHGLPCSRKSILDLYDVLGAASTHALSTIELAFFNGCEDAILGMVRRQLCELTALTLRPGAKDFEQITRHCSAIIELLKLRRPETTFADLISPNFETFFVRPTGEQKTDVGP